jgi:hypothetical protein
MPADYRARRTRGRAGRGEQRREGFAVRKVIPVAILSIASAALLPAGALAGNPSGTGPPSQSCQEIKK